MQRSLLEVRVPRVPQATPLLRPPPPRRPGVELAERARVNGMCLLAPRGHGKSRFLGRQLCFHDLLTGIGSVVIDVVGGTINNALDKVLYLPRTEQLEVGDRLRYCNMSGERIGDRTYVVSWPQLARYYQGESLFTTSQRPLELIRKTDRNLATASIQGYNRLWPLLTSIGMVLTALDEPLSRAFDLLEGSATWKTRLTNLAVANPAAREAALFLLAFFDLPHRVREERTDVLRNKLFHLKVDPISKAMFASTAPPTIDWEEVSYKGLQVYIDLSGNEPDASRELKIMWVWSSLLEYVKSRGARGHEYPPLSVVIDELSYFVRGATLFTEAIAEEFREFAEVRSRNANIYLTIATQDLMQLPESMQAAFLSMGNHLYGTVTDYHTAIELARRWYQKDPKLVKDWHIQYATSSLNGRFIEAHEIDRNAVFYPLEEQDYLNSRTFTELAKGEWLFARTLGEGEQATSLQKISTNAVDRGQYDSQNAALIAQLQSFLMQRDGIAVPQQEVPELPHEWEVAGLDGAAVEELLVSVPGDRTPPAPEPLLVPVPEPARNGALHNTGQPLPAAAPRSIPQKPPVAGRRRGLSG